MLTFKNFISEKAVSTDIWLNPPNGSIGASQKITSVPNNKVAIQAAKAAAQKTHPNNTISSHAGITSKQRSNY